MLATGVEPAFPDLQSGLFPLEDTGTGGANAHTPEFFDTISEIDVRPSLH